MLQYHYCCVRRRDDDDDNSGRGEQQSFRIISFHVFVRGQHPLIVLLLLSNTHFGGFHHWLSSDEYSAHIRAQRDTGHRIGRVGGARVNGGWLNVKVQVR